MTTDDAATPSTLPSGTLAPEHRELGSSARRTAEDRMRAALERLQGPEHWIIPQVDAVLAALHRECARRRLELRAAQQEIERLRAALTQQTTRSELHG